MQASHILALDQGTTSSRAIVFDHHGAVVALAQKEFTQHYPQPGWVEHDPLEIWASQAGVAAEALAKAGLDARAIAALGITNQRETTIVWNRASGMPIYPAIVWQDRRTAGLCQQLREQGLEPLFQARTGLLLDAYFSASKLRWILDQVDGARAAAQRGELAFGTVDSWLVWNLSRGALHVTDVSNAARTLLFNIHTLEWDDELLALFDIPRSVLPQVCDSSGRVGCSAAHVLGAQVPIAGIAGDQQAALFGQQCTQPGMAKNTYGTGCFLVMNTGARAIASHQRLLTTIAWKRGTQVHYALEGSIFIAGAVVQWLRDGLGLIREAAEVETLARQVDDSGGVYLVPAFTGLGAPHWLAQARGSLFGVSRGTRAAHLARAALEAIAYQTVDVLRAMETDAGLKIPELRVDGGATANDLLMQFQSDILGLPVARPRVTETTALGAAYLAGLAEGVWENETTLQAQWQLGHRFSPQRAPGEMAAKLQGWQRALAATRYWAQLDEPGTAPPPP